MFFFVRFAYKRQESVPSCGYSLEPAVIWVIFFVLAVCISVFFSLFCDAIFSNYLKMLWEVHLGNSQNTKREEKQKKEKKKKTNALVWPNSTEIFNVCHWNDDCNIFLRFSPTICHGSFVIGLTLCLPVCFFYCFTLKICRNRHKWNAKCNHSMKSS